MAVTNEEKRFIDLMNSAPAAKVSAQSVEAAQALAEGERAAENVDYSTTADGKLDAAINSFLNQNGYRYNINDDEAYKEFAREHSQNALRGRQLSEQGANTLANGYTPTYAPAVASEIGTEQAARVLEYAPQFQALAAREAAARQQNSGNLLSIYSDMANREYARRRDEQGDKMNFLNYLAGKYADERAGDASLDDARAQIYNTRLGAAAGDLDTARELDTRRMQYDSLSADERAKLDEDNYEFNRKLDYEKAKDRYEDRVAAEKAAAKAKEASAKASAKAQTASAKAAAKAQTDAEKAARNAKVNAYKIKDYLSDKKKAAKMTAADKVDLDYNGDGKVNDKDLWLAQVKGEEEDIKAGKGLTVRKPGNLNEIVTNIREKARSSTKSIKEVARDSIEKSSNLKPSEIAYLFEYFHLS